MRSRRSVKQVGYSRVKWGFDWLFSRVQNGESIHCDSHMEPTEEKTFDGDLLVSQGNQWQEYVSKEPLVMD